MQHSRIINCKNQFIYFYNTASRALLTKDTFTTDGHLALWNEFKAAKKPPYGTFDAHIIVINRIIYFALRQIDTQLDRFINVNIALDPFIEIDLFDQNSISAPIALPCENSGIIFFYENLEIPEIFLQKLIDKIHNFNSNNALINTEYLNQLFKYEIYNFKNHQYSIFNYDKKDTPDEVSENHRFKSKAMKYINDNIKCIELSCGKICKDIGVSRATLYRIFKPYGGVKCYIKNHRIALAENRLLNNSRHESIGKIADDCGFSSIQSFSHSFRRIHNESPSYFRNRHSR